jgi:nitrate/nitrite transport system permease protein
VRDFRFKGDFVILPAIAVLFFIGGWWALSSTVSRNLPSPASTWKTSGHYVTDPLAVRGQMDQGILQFLRYSLILVAKGYFLALLIGIPLGFLLGVSPVANRMFDPIFQVIRPVSPLAWFPLGLVLMQSQQPAALFTIAIVAMWPTVINTSVGVRAIPQDYLNVARVLKLSKFRTWFSILLPATLPYMFTGFRLSLGLTWLVIVAVEMLGGSIGVGAFLWDGYNSNVYANTILSIIVIGVVGFLLDRVMNLVESSVRRAVA